MYYIKPLSEGDTQFINTSAGQVVPDGYRQADPNMDPLASWASAQRALMAAGQGSQPAGPSYGAGDMMYSGGPNMQTVGAGDGVNPGSPGGGVFGQSAAAYTTGTNTLTDVTNPYAVNQTMNQFINPYRNAVIDNALLRSRQERSKDLNMVRGQAAGASAYGGARHGLVEAELMDRYSQNENELLSRMLQEGFDTRANLALETLGQRASAGQGLINASGTGMDLGTTTAGMQERAGGQQQSLLQRILSQASGQTDTMINYPTTALGTALAGVQGNPLAGNATKTSSYNPGMFDYLSFGSGLMGGGK